MCSCIAHRIHRRLFSRLAILFMITRFRGPLMVKSALARSRVVSVSMISMFFMVNRIRSVTIFSCWHPRCSNSRVALTKGATPSRCSFGGSAWRCCPVVHTTVPTHACKLESCRRLQGPFISSGRSFLIHFRNL